MTEHTTLKRHISYYIDTDVPTTNPSIVHVMKMCQAFVRNGYDVTLFCNKNEMPFDPNVIFAQYGITECFDIQLVHVPVFLRNHGHRLAAYYSAWLKARIARRGSFVYSRSALSLYFLRNRSSYVYEAHLEPDVLNKEIERAVLRSSNCKGLVVISHALKRRYLEIFPFLQEEQITVLHDAADADIPEETEKVILKGDVRDIKIGYIGSLFPGKCMETLLPLARKCLQFSFHIVGGTNDWIDYWKQLAAAEHIDNLYFYGHIDNSKVGDYYRAFDICILPFSKDIFISRNKLVNIGKWTSPLKLFEAMAYGKPIIVSRLATIEEVMSDGEDCIMVEPDNIQNWAEKLTALCNDRHLQKKIGAAAKEKLERDYTWLERARKASALFD